MSTGINHSIMSLHEDNSLLDSACPYTKLYLPARELGVNLNGIHA